MYDDVDGESTQQSGKTIPDCEFVEYIYPTDKR